MDTKIKIGNVRSYTTTDNTVFSGKGSKSMAEKYQWALDKKAGFDKFDVFMREIFGIKCKYDPDGYSEEEIKFCNNMMKEVCVSAEDGDFKDEISEFIFDLFGFIGQYRWLQIYDFLTKEK